MYNNYLSCPGFNDKYEKLEILYSSYEEKYLTELCFTQLQFWLTELNITTKVIRSSSLQTNEVKSNLILELCQLCNANEYISGPMGKNYLNEDEFTKSGIDIYYHIYEHITYPQRFGSFIPCMGIIDFWFNRFTY
ncbi:WbqC family protein [Aeromonas veronii]|uniref:WbqC family protein n=1 Tax=Aeromonas veronii TaxID=654 RepID=UPI003C6FF5DF